MTISDVEIIAKTDTYDKFVRFRYDGIPYQAKIKYSKDLNSGVWKEVEFDPYITPGAVIEAGPRLLEIINSTALMAKHAKLIKLYKTDDPIERIERELRKPKKEVNLNIRCTLQQRNKCRERAKEAGMSLSAWIIERCC